MKGWMLVTSATIALSASLSASATTLDQKTQPSFARQAIYQSWSLNDQQKDQLSQENKAFHARLETLENQTFDNTRARHDAMKAIVQEHRKALARVLDDKQLRVLEGLNQRAVVIHARGALRTALFDSWKLDDAQKKAIQDAQHQMRQDIAALHHDQSATGGREERRANMEKIRAQQHARLSRVLSAEQIRVLEMMRHEELRGPKSKAPIDVRRALVQSWHLDASQLDAMKAAAGELHQKMARIQDDATPKDGQRRQQMIEARTDFHHSLEDILSPDQLTALESISPRHGSAMGPRHHGAEQNAASKPDQS
ncbi:hypothetical protein [Kushneria marisflavi]|uniref:Uncharacterized protein n=1 Tax=Kushneria marisflavi TaxID=157779 RepID=A0A240ULF9_9GAMM|nr:hypothetical protein [Kushneria marisflavi]ART62334.1 hypothetical protein B9H00_03970 [Kushneria marisflavi]RKD87439.1 hypothetical protein C8D96_0915 [Kushneria marisflavi]